MKNQAFVVLFITFALCLQSSLAVVESQCCTSETWTNCPSECNGDCCPLNSIKVCGEESRCIPKVDVKSHMNLLERKVSTEACDFYDQIEQLYKCGEKGYPLSYGKKYCQQFLSDAAQYENQEWHNSVRKCLQKKIISEIDRTYKEQRAYVCDNLSNFAFEAHVECYIQPEPSNKQLSYCNNSFADNFKMLYAAFKGGDLTQIARQYGPMACLCALGEVEYENYSESQLQNVPICYMYKAYDSKKYLVEFAKPYYEEAKSVTAQTYSSVQEKIKNSVEEAKEIYLQKYEQVRKALAKQYDDIKEVAAVKKIKDIKDLLSNKTNEIAQALAIKYEQAKDSSIGKQIGQVKDSLVVKIDQFKNQYAEKFEVLKVIASEQIVVAKDKATEKYQEVKEISILKFGQLKEEASKKYDELSILADQKYGEAKVIAVQKFEDLKVLSEKGYELATDYLFSVYSKGKQYFSSKGFMKSEEAQKLKSSSNEKKDSEQVQPKKEE